MREFRIKVVGALLLCLYCIMGYAQAVAPRTTDISVTPFFVVTSETADYVAVDLGLPSGVKWASFNIGASAPEETGGFFQWGEVEEGKGIEFEYSKYSLESNLTILEPADDAAHVQWGAEWRIPTEADAQELIDHCTRIYTTHNGVEGLLMTGPNGNTIFLPVASSVSDEFNITGAYRTSCLGGLPGDELSFNDRARDLIFMREDLKVHWNVRSYRSVIRPVYGQPIKCTISVTNDGNGSVAISGNDAASVSVVKGTMVTVKAIPDEGCKFLGWYLESDGTQLSSSSTYTFSVTASVALVARFKEDVAIMDERAIDLGLPSGVKWASVNLGATSLYEFGAYYAWGETEPKSAYTWSTYKWADGSGDQLTKYCTDESYGTIDGRKVLDAADDAACVQWGGEWRMPTMEELHELLNRCTWIRESVNDVPGFKVVGPNGNSIFLPSAYFYNESGLSTGVEGCYWSSSLCEDENHKATFIGWIPNPDAKVLFNYERCWGKTIRPVCGTPIRYAVTLGSVKNGTIAIAGTEETSAIVMNGSTITVMATPDEDHEFKCWEAGGVAVSTSSTYTFTVEGDVNLTAVFYKKTIVTETEAIDLGLPSGVKWASCNVGATLPEDWGGHYAWARTERYPEWGGGMPSKYTESPYVLKEEDDVARVHWGENWRTPSVEDASELLRYCEWESTTLNEVKGMRITGPNGHSIFLPYTGIMWPDGSIWNAFTGNVGAYMLNTALDSHYVELLLLWNDGSSSKIWDHTIDWGYPVRPVCDPLKESITIGQYGSATYCSSHDLDFSGVKGLKAYVATGYNKETGVVTLTRVQTAVAGTGLFLKGEPGEYHVRAIDESNDYTLNMLVGTQEVTTVNSTSDDGAYANFKYTIREGDAEPMFYRFEDGATLSANKAYLQLPSRLFASTQAAKQVKLRFDEGTTTDIQEVAPQVNEDKAVYDLSGRRVKNSAKGIVIENGKMVWKK